MEYVVLVRMKAERLAVYKGEVTKHSEEKTPNRAYGPILDSLRIVYYPIDNHSRSVL